jgi:hypothetical protein
VAIGPDGAVLKRDTTRPTDMSELDFSSINSLMKVAVTALVSNSSSQTAMMPARIQC